MDVSVVVACYCPVWEKLKSTLESILFQKNVSFEIIIVDDSSEIDYFDKIQELFADNNFLAYQLIKQTVNRGTVKNIIAGVEIAQGRFVKLISPGDYLYQENSLIKFVQFCNVNQVNAVFGRGIYYIKEGSRIIVRNNISTPRYPEGYSLPYQLDSARLQYLVQDDLALGAATFVERTLLYHYLNEIVNKVIYAEDNAYRLMVAEGIPFVYVPEFLVWYEMGTGISTGTNKAWFKKLHQDWNNTDHIILKRLNLSKSCDKKIWFYLHIYRKLRRYVRILLIGRNVSTKIEKHDEIDISYFCRISNSKSLVFQYM